MSNNAIHLSRRHMSSECPNLSLRPGDGERSAGKELPLWLPVHLNYGLSASGAFGRAVFILLQ